MHTATSYLAVQFRVPFQAGRLERRGESITKDPGPLDRLSSAPLRLYSINLVRPRWLAHGTHPRPLSGSLPLLVLFLTLVLTLALALALWLSGFPVPVILLPPSSPASLPCPLSCFLPHLPIRFHSFLFGLALLLSFFSQAHSLPFLSFPLHTDLTSPTSFKASSSVRFDSRQRHSRVQVQLREPSRHFVHVWPILKTSGGLAHSKCPLTIDFEKPTPREPTPLRSRPDKTRCDGLFSFFDDPQLF